MKQMKELKHYNPPFTQRSIVEVEGNMCTSGDPATLKKDETVTIEVEEYTEIENKVTFD